MNSNNCQLCKYADYKPRIVHETDLVYSMIPNAPLLEGHVLVLPKKHKIMQALSAEELMALADMTGSLKDKLKTLYPLKHPLLVSQMDTMHSTIPGHFHYHLIPSGVNIRELVANSDSSISSRKELPIRELERMAILLRT